MSTIVRWLMAHDVIDEGVKHAGYAADWDAYKARLADVEELAPGLCGAFSPLGLLDEDVAALVNSAWLAGAEYGERLMKGEASPSPSG